jgi:AraC family transcriptional regulator of adaptative response/methylated-DNA-[protein]-cysteine methyltransferase
MAGRAFGLSGDTDIAPVQDEPVVRVLLEVGRHVVFDGPLDRDNILAHGNAGAVADTEDVGIDRLRGKMPPHIQNDVGRLAPHARKRLQSRSRIGHRAVIVVDQDATQLHHVFRLLAEKSDGLDMLGQSLFAKVEHLLRRIGDLKQLARGLVHARIGRLRGKGNGDEKGKGVDVLKLAPGLGLGGMETLENLAHPVIGKLLGHAHGYARPTRLRQAPLWRRNRVAVALRALYPRRMEQNRSYHFQIMRRAIDLIDAQPGVALSLEALAAEMNLSPAHFQRVFSQWVGVSPKRYHQYLTLDQAKELLRERHTTLETADAVGLSGSGRLHDLFLRWEAMSPGDYAKGGEGLTIFWGWFDSPFGPALVMGTGKGICGIGFSAQTGEAHAMSDLTSRWPKARYVEDAERLRPWVEAAFGAEPASAPLFLIGAPFQIKVWEALLAIPSGHVTTYSDIADAIGHPKAVRAVGTAVGRNPISLLIPCHRALRKSGGLGGYHWGLPVKRAILAYESARLEA